MYIDGFASFRDVFDEFHGTENKFLNITVFKEKILIFIIQISNVTPRLSLIMLILPDQLRPCGGSGEVLHGYGVKPNAESFPVLKNQSFKNQSFRLIVLLPPFLENNKRKKKG